VHSTTTSYYYYYYCHHGPIPHPYPIKYLCFNNFRIDFESEQATVHTPRRKGNNGRSSLTDLIKRVSIYRYRYTNERKWLRNSKNFNNICTTKSFHTNHILNSESGSPQSVVLLIVMPILTLRTECNILGGTSLRKMTSSCRHNFYTC
jgi:hypothetical protein